MEGKALYNLLRINSLEDPNLEVEPWAIEEYREIPTEELFLRLKKLAIPLNEQTFLHYAENCDSPEQMAEMLWTQEEYSKDFDQSYLLIFELWRRLLPGKQTLSLFCNDLDHLIFLYDRDKLEDQQPLQEALQQLETILDENVDQGANPAQLFQTVLDHSAHDIESFLHDYISDQIEQENGLYASELIDGFYAYVQNKRWLDFERMRLLTMTDHDEGMLMLSRILDDLGENPDFELLMQIAHFLAHQDAFEFLLRTLLLAKPLIQTEADFQEMLLAATEFYRLSDQAEREDALQSLISKRASIPLDEAFSPSDPDLNYLFKEFLQD
ncbi:MAG TPA: hypothetical protein VLG76_07195 [Rhabdochlamydiaceae bacterium]|nr:hypothetical protein [Rhabdochlamydiaceae bacterium]